MLFSPGMDLTVAAKEPWTMPIKCIDVLNVLVFQRQLRKFNGDAKLSPLKDGDQFSDGFHLDFGAGINVLIGENGVGKTSLLKMIYAATQWSIEKTEVGKTRQLLHFFSDHLKDNMALRSANHEDGYCTFSVSDGEHKFEYSLSHDGFFNFDDWLGLNYQSVYIPTMEMLSHAKGFLAMNQKYSMPFDGTQIDIIVNASLPETREVSPVAGKILEKLSSMIDGTVVQEDDIFYVLKKDGRKVDFSLEAEGLRKFGLLWKLVRNGLLEKGSILIWDEPEANMNPEMYPVLADIILALADYGVQCFVATHSYNFAKYLEIRKTKPGQVLFHNLYKGSTEIPEELRHFSPVEEPGTAIYSSTAETLEELASNSIMTADQKLLDEVYDFRRQS